MSNTGNNQMHHNNYPNPHNAQKQKNSGFSIVEVLVAGALLAIAVIAVVAVVQKSGDLQSAGSKRLAARMFLATQFEEKYGAGKYALVQTPATNPRTVQFGVDDTGTFNTTISTGSASGIPYKEITLTLTWPDVDNTLDSIRLMKWLAE
jgi:type II secretory pathway pseudopilin PulG